VEVSEQRVMVKKEGGQVAGYGMYVQKASKSPVSAPFSIRPVQTQRNGAAGVGA